MFRKLVECLALEESFSEIHLIYAVLVFHSYFLPSFLFDLEMFVFDQKKSEALLKGLVLALGSSLRCFCVNPKQMAR